MNFLSCFPGVNRLATVFWQYRIRGRSPLPAWAGCLHRVWFRVRRSVIEGGMLAPGGASTADLRLQYTIATRYIAQASWANVSSRSVLTKHRLNFSHIQWFVWRTSDKPWYVGWYQSACWHSNWLQVLPTIATNILTRFSFACFRRLTSLLRYLRQEFAISRCVHFDVEPKVDVLVRLTRAKTF